MPVKSWALEKAIEVLGDQALSAQTLAYRVGCSRAALMVLVRKGELVAVGTTPRPRDRFGQKPQGITIVCAPAYAELHKRAA